MRKIIFPVFTFIIIVIFWVISQYDGITPQQNPNQNETKLSITEPEIFQQEPISLIFFGDIMLARSIQTHQKSRPQNWPFNGIQDLISESNLAMGNLESPIGDESITCEDCYRFSIQQDEATILKTVDFDLMTIANNHANDFADSPTKTKTTLENLGINAVGYISEGNTSQQPVIKEVDSYTIGFLSYSSLTNTNFDHIAEATEENIQSDILALKNTVDLIIVNIHWGNEYTYQVTAEQKNLAHVAVDAGADVIIGHHAHWMQPVEQYQHSLIFYGLGNTVFNMMYSMPTRQGFAVRAVINRNDQTLGFELIPMLIEDYARPRILEPDESEYIEIEKILTDISPTVSFKELSVSTDLPEKKEPTL
ncbi:CapA family protein [candidate division WWE3 bacterium]|uniref:CapA family protein n=1 Tax=candidate division WWE3 bacterium TaxID=2053526 RepID=A0A955LH81_UNCKA|nr:CapA family protein [candidate division WWE3 bacterium]